MHHFQWFYWKYSKKFSNTGIPTSLMNWFFKTGANFFRFVIVFQFIDLLQKSELKKVHFCACGMSFCKTLQKPVSAKKSDSTVHICIPSTKIDATGTIINFFEFWFFCWVRNLQFYNHLKNYWASQKTELMGRVWIGGHFYWRHGYIQ